VKQDRELYIPVDRLAPIIDRWEGVRSRLSESAQTRMQALKTQRYMTLAAADKLLVELGLDDYWHYRKEDGGLADIYEDGAQYGRPSTPPRPPLKYRTDEERLEAARRSHRESKRRLALQRISLRCPRCGQSRMVGRDYAKRAQAKACKKCHGRLIAAAWHAFKQEAAA